MEGEKNRNRDTGRQEEKRKGGGKQKQGENERGGVLNEEDRERVSSAGRTRGKVQQ